MENKLKKYEELRNKIVDPDYEEKNRGIKNWIVAFSYLGNIGSIFFAFFLVQPALLSAIGANLIDGKASLIVASVITVVVMSGFEILKRLWLDKTSMDLVKESFKLTSESIRFGILSMLFIAGSMYLSISGAVKFAVASEQENTAIEINVDAQIDSLTLLTNDKKEIIENEITSLREDNSALREQIKELPATYKNTRQGLTETIDFNNKEIESNEQRIAKLDQDLADNITQLKAEQDILITENQQEDGNNIIFFFLLSTVLEFIIIWGVYYKDKYQFNVFLHLQKDMEGELKHKERYKKLLKYVFGDGKVDEGDRVIAASKLLELIKENSSVPSPKKLVDDFYNDMDYHQIIKLEGKRRVACCSYEDALKKIDEHNDGSKILAEL